MVQAAAEALLNAHRVSMCATVPIHTIVLVDPGIPGLIVPTVATRQQDSATAVPAVAEARQNVHLGSIDATVISPFIVPADTGIPELIVPTAATRQPENARAVQVQTVHPVNINVLIILHINVPTVLGHGIKIALMVVTCQKVNVTSVLTVIINAVATIHIIVNPDIGYQMNTAPKAVIHQQANAKGTNRVSVLSAVVFMAALI